MEEELEEEKKPKKMSRKDRFVEEYVIDHIGSKAAIRAGYSPKTAAEQASRLLANVNIRARVDKLDAEHSRRCGISVERVLEELARVGFANYADIINDADATLKEGVSRDDLAAVASVRVKIIPTEEGNIVEREVKLHDKKGSLELLGKHLGIFEDKVRIGNIHGENGKAEPIQVIFDIPRPEEPKVSADGGHDEDDPED